MPGTVIAYADAQHSLFDAGLHHNARPRVPEAIVQQIPKQFVEIRRIDRDALRRGDTCFDRDAAIGVNVGDGLQQSTQGSIKRGYRPC